MKRMNRRHFAKLAGGAALAPGVASFSPPPLGASQSPQQPAGPPAAETAPPYGMTKEQEARVKRNIERREQQNAALRSRTLPYSLEAAFVFHVKEGATSPAPRKANARG